jgi:pyruvate,water dikinase
MYCIPFNQIRNSDVSKVGGKNASLGEMTRKLGPFGIEIPDGFAVSADAFRLFLSENNLEAELDSTLKRLDSETLKNLAEIGSACRAILEKGKIPDIIGHEISAAYRLLSNSTYPVAVRSSATAEDLPTASFAGQHDSFLNVLGLEDIIHSVKKCYISLYNDRAIKYRIDHGFKHKEVALSVGIQRMVRADLSAAGVAFTLDPESGNDKVIYITSAWGLAENIVQGAVIPDEIYLFKTALEKGKKSIISRKIGEKAQKMIFSANVNEKTTLNVPCTIFEKHHLSLEENELELLGKQCLDIEKHYGMPMDIEWAKDGPDGRIYIVQARPETVHKKMSIASIKEYRMKSDAKEICRGMAVGNSILAGRVCRVSSIADADKVQNGDIIVAEMTNPDWNAMLRKAVCIVTDKGGRTSHASIIARELGISAVVGCVNATTLLSDDQLITVSTSGGNEGLVFEGKLNWEVKEIFPEAIEKTRTAAMFILANPDTAFRLSQYPNNGVGLLRMEFIISNSIRIHPMALVKYDELPESKERELIGEISINYTDKRKFFIEKLSEAIGTVAAAFYPKEVIVRMSDFKSNEYAQLLGGKMFEPEEENPMLGFRGASRYYDERYRLGFGLECAAIRYLRQEMGFDNIKVMIPFCRTPEEGKKVLETMKSFGLERGKNGLEVYVMAEIPSNVILANEFAEIFDGFSIGSNDLTQLTLGIDRDSVIVSKLFDENNPAVKYMLSTVIKAANNAKKRIGLCGQAPSDYPEFTRFLVEQGIDSISFTPDSILRGIKNIAQAEENNG